MTLHSKIGSYDPKGGGRRERERIFSKCKKECKGVRGQRVGFGAFSFLCSPSVGTVFTLWGQWYLFIFKEVI